MKVFLLAFATLLFNNPAFAEPNWQACLDQSELSLNANDGFLNFAKVAKSGCNLRFVTLGGKGEKLEVNLCDANIHVDQFPAIDSTQPSRYFAGNAGCPSPTFGADFNERLDELQKYEEAKAHALAILDNVNKIFSKNPVDLEKITINTVNTTEAKAACVNYLARQYLEKCVAFEERKFDPPAPTNLPPGVHPQVIRK